MIRVPVEIFAFSSEAAAMARGGRLVFANAEARLLLGSDWEGKSVEAAFGPEVAGTQAASFVADVVLDDKRCSLRSTRQDGAQLFFFGVADCQLPVLNDAFIYSLRSSLMTVNMALELCRAKAEEQGSVEILSSLREISRSQFRLTRLVSNASMLQNSVSGGFCFNPVPVDAAQLCRECVDCVRGLVDGVEFSLGAADTMLINADPGLLKKLLLNLISNCLIHAAGCSRIKINLLDSADTVFISVSDDGQGIEQEQLHRVFDRYRHIYDASEMNGGAGIGLSVVRLIAQKHGGTLLLESRSGQGTTVQVSLKKNKTAGMALRSTDAEGFEIKTALTELADCLDSSFYDEKYMD